MSTNPSSINVRAIVTEKLTASGFLKNLGVGQVLDNASNLVLANALELELISAQLHDHGAGILGARKQRVKAEAHPLPNVVALLSKAHELEEMEYEAKFEVPVDFGEIGAILVLNEHHEEMFLRRIVLHGLPYGNLNIDCDSWVQSKSENPQPRVFFSNKHSGQVHGERAILATEMRELQSRLLLAAPRHAL